MQGKVRDGNNTRGLIGVKMSIANVLSNLNRRFFEIEAEHGRVL